MSEHNKLYIITRDIEENDICQENFWRELLIFADLHEALNKLNDIFKKTPDFKDYNYHIKVYDKINKTYIVSHQNYFHQTGYS